jgi:hypothetical protein
MALKCPFCGAPQGRAIPYGTVQIRCKYCNGLIVIPRSMSIDMEQCPNHPDRAVSEKCNDCGEYFCDLCLQPYDLLTRSGEVVSVYLCPRCLERRQLKKYEDCTSFGIASLLGAVLIAVFVLPFTILGFCPLAILIIIGTLLIALGSSQKQKAAKETSVTEPQAEEEEAEEPTIALQSSNIDETYARPDEIYSKLLTYYTARWGPETGKKWLDLDILAYTRHRVTFAEAVNRIYKQEEKNIKCDNSENQR